MLYIKVSMSIKRENRRGCVDSFTRGDPLKPGRRGDTHRGALLSSARSRVQAKKGGKGK